MNARPIKYQINLLGEIYEVERYRLFCQNQGGTIWETKVVFKTRWLWLAKKIIDVLRWLEENRTHKDIYPVKIDY